MASVNPYVVRPCYILCSISEKHNYKWTVSKLLQFFYELCFLVYFLPFFFLSFQTSVNKELIIVKNFVATLFQIPHVFVI